MSIIPGWKAALDVVAEPTQKRLQIKGIDHIGKEPGHVLLGKTVIQLGGQQKKLVRVVVPEVITHGPSRLSNGLNP